MPQTIENTDSDAIPVNVWSDESGFYWQRQGDRREHGPFHTRGSAKWDAGSELYMEAGKAGVRFVE